MVFYPPAWVPPLPFDPPDALTIEQFMTSEAYGPPLAARRNPFTCGITGRSYSWPQVVERTDHLARSLAARLGWQDTRSAAAVGTAAAAEAPTPWDRVVAVFSLNTVDYLPAVYAVHRLGGIVTPANAAYAADELQHQLAAAGARALFTCAALLPTARAAAAAAGIAPEHVFVLDVPGAEAAEAAEAASSQSVHHLIAEGAALPPVPPVRFLPGQGARQPAFLSFSSGTSGLPKAVVIAHRNVIANTLQIATYERVGRRFAGVAGVDQSGGPGQVEVGLLPFSHIYGLVVIAHAGPFRGDEVVVLPKFELAALLAAVQAHRIQLLRLVPPILLRLLHSHEACRRYDLGSVRFVYTGAAPAGAETLDALRARYPGWRFGQGYGLTETSTLVCSNSEHDTLDRSSGSLVPGVRAKLVDPADGGDREITAYDTPGELLVQSPSVALGYLHNERATAATFVHHADGRWMRTGDEVLVTLHPRSGTEHLVVVDRIKELIKVKGHQVAPAELEAHLLTLPGVADAAVVPVPDDRAGEVPKAFVVRAAADSALSDADLAARIVQSVQQHKAPYKWLKGGVEFIDAVPKSPSGKILRRLLRDRARAPAAKL